MGNWILNEGPKWLIMFIWISLNIVLFLVAFFRYNDGLEYFYLRQFVGLGLPFARGAAACLNLNCMLILLPVCRNLVSFLRGGCAFCKRNVRRQLDRNITFHKYIAYAICLFTVIHVGAHCFNVEYFVQAYDETRTNRTSLLSTLSLLDDPYLNPVRVTNSNPILEALKLLAGVSGVILTVCLILIIGSATELLRKFYFEVFWFTHHVAVLFFIGLVVHGMQGAIRRQTNLDKHDPEKCYKTPFEWGPGKPCAVPKFDGSGAQTWKWIVFPMFVYFIERCIRFYRSLKTAEIVKVVHHPSRVIEIQIKKTGFIMQPGQYVFIQCESISRLEWHPFTLTSAPSEDHFSVHIRRVGDWTNALARVCGADGTCEQQTKLPRLSIDGPFGTATEDIFRYEVDVLVAAGIGVTPFASVLKHIWHMYSEPDYQMKLRKVYFYWICPDTNAFEWFSDLLHSLEKQMIERGKDDFLNYNIYLTRGWDSDQARNIALQDDETYDAVTGLRQKTYYGRPQWQQIFSGIAEENPGISIGCFFCGPKLLSTTLHKICNEQSSAKQEGVHFFYNKENF